MLSPFPETFRGRFLRVLQGFVAHQINKILGVEVLLCCLAGVRHRQLKTLEWVASPFNRWVSILTAMSE